MIKAIELSGEFIRRALTFELRDGSRSAFIFNREEERNEFLQLITGIKRPLTGEVYINGTALSQLSRDELLKLRRKIGVLFPGGGLINNLRAWENLVLPAMYHRLWPGEVIKERGLNLLKELGFQKKPLTRVSDLTSYEKLIIGLGRAWLLEPEILILNTPFSGLTEIEKDSIISIINKMLSTGQSSSPGREGEGISGVKVFICIGNSPEEVKPFGREIWSSSAGEDESSPFWISI